ncbi:hypothetical protein P168DRAFT_157656 [Aspergillus campestris IBT 28561]|uniref:Uncharacterized protein n=1 Tax=Aspergillus campestris (strain IBT 28561) TaxID=1392248 RepID=A0A2I1D3E7_ASPC2|nr:uncharacterized protein P168DRAFT_157656 [Aspergillus campestris IBT 28561]PKY04392.1 hypothetical protein P168DRAFT_157656 [Aspergillus campestris IBT 28561]
MRCAVETFRGLVLGARIAALDRLENALQPWLTSLTCGCTYVLIKSLSWFCLDPKMGLLLVSILITISRQAFLYLLCWPSSCQRAFSKTKVGEFFRLTKSR